MSNEKTFRANEVCEALNISIHTLQKWYQWEKYELRDGIVSQKYLPEPTKILDQRGKPKTWTEKQIQQLQEFKKSIVSGRHGRYGKYTNPLHKKEEVNE